MSSVKTLLSVGTGLALALAAGQACQANVILGGDCGPGSLSNWGNSFTASLAATNSPFTNVYANNNSSLAPAGANGANPWLSQSAATGISGQAAFNYDFNLADASSYDLLLVMSSTNQNAVRLFMGNAGSFTLQSSSDAFASTLTLGTVVANNWYNVNGVFDLTAHKLGFTITSQDTNTAPIVVTNIALDSSLTDVGGFIFTNWGTKNPGNVYDNLSISTVPEPTSLGLVGVGISLLATRRRRSVMGR